MVFHGVQIHGGSNFSTNTSMGGNHLYTNTNMAGSCSIINSNMDGNDSNTNSNMGGNNTNTNSNMGRNNSHTISNMDGNNHYGLSGSQSLLNRNIDNNPARINSSNPTRRDKGSKRGKLLDLYGLVLITSPYPKLRQIPLSLDNSLPAAIL